jgi:hypothetical protein
LYRSDKLLGDIEAFLQESTTLIIDIPLSEFIGKIQLLIPYRNLASKCTFISSTSVYGDCNDNVTEETDLKPESEGGRQLVIVGSWMNSRFKTTVLRFGGLIGEDKVYILAGRKTSTTPCSR